MEYSAFRFCLAASSWDKIRELEGRKGGSRSSSSEGGVKGDGLLRDKERQGTCWGRCLEMEGRVVSVCLSVLSHCRYQFALRTVEQREGDTARLALDTDTFKHKEHKALMFKE